MYKISQSESRRHMPLLTIIQEPLRLPLESESICINKYNNLLTIQYFVSL